MSNAQAAPIQGVSSAPIPKRHIRWVGSNVELATIRSLACEPGSIETAGLNQLRRRLEEVAQAQASLAAVVARFGALGFDLHEFPTLIALGQALNVLDTMGDVLTGELARSEQARAS